MGIKLSLQSVLSLRAARNGGLPTPEYQRPALRPNLLLNLCLMGVSEARLVTSTDFRWDRPGCAPSVFSGREPVPSPSRSLGDFGSGQRLLSPGLLAARELV